ncbi:methyl-accepting chemotaxis protein [Nitratidesulfovibrio vulgaris]|uniref:methyl-accepting chemotaxis protein n=1 Tax=Nitratidesulfovibrio vulgaris TaxID=881 RepID=UPI0013E0D6B9|nr:methyl-accepting chemotaxis protein [Nitratidesulfovibrio vulgaris]
MQHRPALDLAPEAASRGRFQPGVGARLLLLVGGIVALFVLTIFVGILPTVEQRLLAARGDALRNMIQNVDKLLQEYDARVQKGEFTREEGMKRAALRIGSMRYGNNDYFWINDTGTPYPTMIMHPVATQLVGKVLDSPNYQRATGWRTAPGEDFNAYPAGKNLFQAFVDVVQRNGSGLVSYAWPKPLPGGGASSELYNKESYVTLFRPWGWIVGTGVYVDDIERDVTALRLRVLTLSGGILLLVCAFGWILIRSIRRPLDSLASYARKVADGDLGAHVSGSFIAEFGELKHSLETMVEALRTKIAEAQEKTDEASIMARHAEEQTHAAEAAREEAERARSEGMVDAANQLEAIVRDVGRAASALTGLVRVAAEGAGRQRARVGETSVSMEEMNATVLDVARNAGQAATTSEAARAKAQQGAGGVEQVVASVAQVEREAASLRESMGALSKRADAIGQIMSVISDIADQTNLLALNAAIEAARAGEAGRGFAVVADEVRKLAEKTMNATKEVDSAIRGIQQGTGESSRNVDAASRAVGEAAEHARAAGESLGEIVRLAEQVSDQIRSIATASEEQSSSSESIAHALDGVAGVADDTSRAMDDAMHSLRDLEGGTTNLTRLIERLKKS